MLTIKQAQLKLRDLLPVLRNSWIGAWEMLFEHTHPAFTPGCRAHMLQNLAVDNMKKQIGEVLPDARFTVQENKQELILDGVAVIAFKKLDEQLRVRNNLTKRAKGFYEQRELPGMEGLTHLVAGIKVNTDWTAYDGVYLVQPGSYSRNNWILNITEEVAEIDANQIRINLKDDEEPFFTAPKTDEEEETNVENL